jgi:arylsulfatase A-like enzyme
VQRRQFLQAIAGAAAAPAMLRARPKRPNIVLIMADDMGFSDIGCYGSEIATPNLDRLARGGVRFTQFYNNARCCPTRASLLTGLYPHQAGIGHMMGDYKLPAYRGNLGRNAVTIAEALRPAGYHTLMAGKWHVTPVGDQYRDNWPLQRGFEHYYGTIMGGGSYYAPASLQRDNVAVTPGTGDFYYTDAIGENAARMAGEYARKSEPFFLYTAFTSPHWPLHARPEDIARYRDRYRAGWDKLREERHRKQLELGIVERRWPVTDRDKQVPAWDDEKNKEWQIRRMAVYAAQVDAMDRNIGRILASIEQAGAMQNTLVMFLSDNGGCAEELRIGAQAQHIPVTTRDGRPLRPGNDPSLPPGPEDTYASYGIGWANASNTPFRLYKHWVHEGGISTPLVAHWPEGIRKQGLITPQYGHIIDLMATCVDAAGAVYPSRHQGNAITPLEGRSLLPILSGGKRPAPELYWEHEGNRATRQGKWKLVSRFNTPWELYDMKAGRTETADLAARQPQMAARLQAKWESWAKRVGVEPWGELRKRQINT